MLAEKLAPSDARRTMTRDLIEAFHRSLRSRSTRDIPPRTQVEFEVYLRRAADAVSARTDEYVLIRVCLYDVCAALQKVLRASDNTSIEFVISSIERTLRLA